MKNVSKFKKKKQPESGFSCDFCGKNFQREETIFKHLCEAKRRHQNKDLPGNRIGFQTWLEFYRRNSLSKKQKTYNEFAKSAYYIAFVKFGNYCIDIKCISINRYTDWLLSNNIKLDNWCSDSVYDKFLIEYLRKEDPMDAIARSIETTIEYAKNEGINSNDYLRYGNKNRICSLIVNGKISPLMLYQSKSGITLLENLDPTQQTMVYDYINPEQWTLKFKRDPDSANQISNLLNQAGY